MPSLCLWFYISRPNFVCRIDKNAPLKKKTPTLTIITSVTTDQTPVELVTHRWYKASLLGPDLQVSKSIKVILDKSPVSIRCAWVLYCGFQPVVTGLITVEHVPPHRFFSVLKWCQSLLLLLLPSEATCRKLWSSNWNECSKHTLNGVSYRIPLCKNRFIDGAWFGMTLQMRSCSGIQRLPASCIRIESISRNEKVLFPHCWRSTSSSSRHTSVCWKGEKGEFRMKAALGLIILPGICWFVVGSHLAAVNHRRNHQ